MSAAARSDRPFGGPVLLVLIGLLLVVVDVGVSGGGDSLAAWLAADFAPDVAGFALMTLGAAGAARTGVRWAPLAVLAFLLAAAASLVALGGSSGALGRRGGRGRGRARHPPGPASRARRGRDATLAAALAALVLVVVPVDAVPSRTALVLTLVGLGVILVLVVVGLAATTRLQRPGPADGRTFAGRWPEPGTGLAVGAAFLVIAGLGAAVAFGVDWALTREAAAPSDPIDLSLLDGIPTPEGTGRAALTGVPGGGSRSC